MTSDLTYDEQAKRLATGLNTIAIAILVIGVVTPITAVRFGAPTASAVSVWTAIFAGNWLCTGAGLHQVIS